MARPGSDSPGPGPGRDRDTGSDDRRPRRGGGDIDRDRRRGGERSGGRDGGDGGGLPGGGPGTPGNPRRGGDRSGRDGRGGGRGDRRDGRGGRDGKGPNLNMRELAADYGWSLAFLNSNKELKRLFKEAVKKTWSPERFVAELRDTEWFKKHSATARQFMVNRIVDPATWQADLDRVQAHTNNIYGQLFGVPLSRTLQERWAIRAMRNGWTDEQIADHMVATMNFQKLFRTDAAGGTAMQTRNQILEMAGAYGVGFGKKMMARQVEDVLAGSDTIDGVQERLKDLAKSKYVAFRDELDAGRTMAEIADPYVQTASELLELNPGEVDVRNRMIQRALMNRDKNGYRPLSIAEFEDKVRKDPRWMHTQQANDQFEQIASGLLTTWGLI